MILGILSDTHGQQQRTACAIRAMKSMGAESIIHCGDVGATEIFDELAGMRAWVVHGNTDYLDDGVDRYAKSLGITLVPETPLMLDIGGRTIAVFHGHEPLFNSLLKHLLNTGELPEDFGRCDYILHGHTHIAGSTRIGPVRVINPGALVRAQLYTVAILDLRTDRVRFLEITDDAAEILSA